MAIHQNEITRTVLLNHLVEGVCKIAFIKIDGSLRQALATLNYDLIPAQYSKSLDNLFLPDYRVDILPFWDVTEGAWKSFYVDKVEMFIDSKELIKNSPDNKQRQELLDEKTDANELQDVDNNTKKKIGSGQQKTNRLTDNTKDEQTVNPVNRKNISSTKQPKKTRSSITEQYEKHKTSRENAVHILNKLRMEAHKRKEK